MTRRRVLPLLVVVVTATVPMSPTMTVVGLAAAVEHLETGVARDDERPRFDYLLNCAGCHRMDARGSAGVPALTELGPFLATAAGREYLIRVPGAAQAPLSDERLAGLINWLIAEFSAAASFDPYSAEEVGRLRAEPLRDPLRVRKHLVAGKGSDHSSERGKGADSLADISQ